MTSLEAGTPGDLRPILYSGQVVVTRSGAIAVHAANPDDAAPDTPYTRHGYEAYYGSISVEPQSQTFVVTIESSVVGDLVGRRLSRSYQLSGDTLVITPRDAMEGFRATYRRHGT